MVGKVQTNGGKWSFSPSLKRTEPWRCFILGGEKNGAFKIRAFLRQDSPQITNHQISILIPRTNLHEKQVFFCIKTFSGGGIDCMLSREWGRKFPRLLNKWSELRNTSTDKFGELSICHFLKWPVTCHSESISGNRRSETDTWNPQLIFPLHNNFFICFMFSHWSPRAMCMRRQSSPGISSQVWKGTVSRFSIRHPFAHPHFYKCDTEENKIKFQKFSCLIFHFIFFIIFLLFYSFCFF